MLQSTVGYIANKDLSLIGKPTLVENVGFQLVHFGVILGITDTNKTKIYDAINLEFLYEIEGRLLYLIENDLVSYSNVSKKIFVWQKKTGEIKVSYETNKFLMASVLINNKIVSFTRKREICCFDYLQDVEYWSININDRADTFRFMNDKLFYTNRDNILSCRSFINRELMWELDVSVIGKYIDLGEQRQGKIGSTVFLYKNLLIAYVLSSKVIAVHQDSGIVEWEISLDSQFASCSMCSDGYLYCLETYEADNIIVNLYEIDVLRGIILKKKDFRTDIENLTNSSLQYMDYSSIFITEKGLFFSLLEEKLLLKVNRKTFRIEWYYKHHCSITARQILISTNHLLYIDQEHQVFALKSE